ncbi:MAG: hypothetical protein ACOCXP_00835 [Candidatus Dojkabacteria bacterium]
MKQLVVALLRVFISPLVVFFIMLILHGDRREAYLVALLFHTIVSLWVIITSLIKHATPGQIIEFVFTSIGSAITMVFLVFYWLIYLIFWGSQFGLDNTFALF